jgi:hypothetical protein
MVKESRRRDDRPPQYELFKVAKGSPALFTLWGASLGEGRLSIATPQSVQTMK